MSENKTKFVGRRQALKKILGGVGAIGLAKFAPETWAKPQLFSSMLPETKETEDALIEDTLQVAAGMGGGGGGMGGGGGGGMGGGGMGGGGMGGGGGMSGTL